MMLKCRRVIGFVMLCVMMVVMISPVNVYAVEVVGEEVFSDKLEGSSNAVICRVFGTEVPGSLRQN